MIVSVEIKTILPSQVYSLSEQNILVIDINTSYNDTETILALLNGADNVKSNFWFRMLNVQPREAVSRYLPNQSLLFLSTFNLNDRSFVGSSEAGDLIK